MKNLCCSIAPLLGVALVVGILTGTHWTPTESESDKITAEDKQLHEREVRAQKRVSLKMSALRDLMDGQCTLAEAAEIVLELMEPQCRPQLRRSFPAETVEQSQALQIIGNIRSMPMSAQQAAEVLSRLEREFAEMKASGTAAGEPSAGQDRCDSARKVPTASGPIASTTAKNTLLAPVIPSYARQQ
jgi:hypothetical protein